MALFKNRLPFFRDQSLIFIMKAVVLTAVFLFSPRLTSAQTQETNPSPSLFKKLSLEELMDMDVTSVSKKPEPFGQAPAAIQLITGDQIRRSGASSIPEALRLADNLDVAQKGSHNWAISARGFNTDFGNKLLVLMDGRTLYTPLFSGVFWDQQDALLADLDRIEVISGPGGTIWGANAVNGVINITSKSSKETQGFYMEGGGGSELLGFGGLRYGGKLSQDIYYRVYGKYFNRDKMVYPNGGDAADIWSKGQGGFRIDAEHSPEETFTLQGDLYGSDENQSVGGENSRTAGGNILGRWTRRFSDDSNMSFQSYYDRTYLFLPKNASAFAPAGILTDGLDTYDFDFQFHIPWGQASSFAAGAGYRLTHDVVQDTPGLSFVPGTLDHSLLSGFVQDETMLAKNFYFTFGSKFEVNGYTGAELEPSARLKWDLDADQMLWTAVSRAVRTPSRVDRDERVGTPALSFLGIDNLLVGGADFVSETLVAYELGYRAQVARDVSTSLSAFFNEYDDIRSVKPAAPPNLLIFANGLAAETYGVEITLDVQVVDGWRLHGGYDLLKENLWLKPGQTDFSNKLNETADPENRLSFRSSMDFGKSLELDGALRWVDSFIYNNNRLPGVVPGYVELDIRLGWRPAENLELSLTGQNLLNDHHSEYVVSPPDPSEDVQRGVYGKAAWQF